MQKLDLNILQGKTFSRVIRWEKEPFIYVPIQAIARTAPARITAAAHSIPDGWRVAVVSAGGMRQINAQHNPPKAREFVRCTVVDPNTVDLNEINAAGFSPYTSGGYLQHYTPASLAGATARMTIRNRVGGTELLALTSPVGIAIDDATKTITPQISAAATAALTWRAGVYDLEIEDAAGVVTGLFYGAVTVTPEVTT